MNRTKTLSCCALLLWLAMPWFAWAQAPGGTPLSPEAAKVSVAPAPHNVLPENVLGFAILNGLSETNGKIAKLAAAVGAPVPGVLEMVKLKAGISEGLDERGSLILALLPGDEESRPLEVLFVPVTDYGAFVGQFGGEAAEREEEAVQVTVDGRQFLAAKVGGFAAFGPPDRGPEFIAALGVSKNASELLEPLRRFITNQDAALVVTPEGVKQVLAAARKGLKDAGAAFEGLSTDPKLAPQFASVKQVFAVYDGLLGGLEGNVTHFALGGRIDKAGNVHVRSRTLFTKEGDLAALAAELQPLPKKWLHGLPAGPYVFAFEGAFPEKAMRGMMKMSASMMAMMPGGAGQKLTEEQTQQIAESMAQSARGIQAFSLVMGVPRPGTSLYSSMAGLVRVDDSDKYLANYRDAMEKYNDAVKGIEGRLWGPFKISETDVDGRDGLELTMDFSRMTAGLEGDPAASKMLETMFGPGGKLNAYLVALDERTLAVSYIDKQQVAKIVEALESNGASLGGDADVARTTKLLPQDAHWVVLLDVSGGVQFIQNMMALAPVETKVPPFPKTAPLGFTASLSKGGLTTHLVAPAPLIKTIGDYVKLVGEGATKAGPPTPEFKAAPVAPPLRVDEEEIPAKEVFE